MLALPFVNFGTGQIAVQIAAAPIGATCVVLSDHSVKCWGDNATGIFGDGTTTSKGSVGGQMSTLTPVSLFGAKVAQLSMGGDHACAVLDNRTVMGREHVWTIG